MDNLKKELSANVGRKCEVVPFNTIEWVGGYIAGVTEDKKGKKLLYVIKTDDGRRIVKMHNSPLLKILDEKVKIPTREKRERGEWAEMEAEIDEAGESIGCPCRVTEKDGTTVEGRIVGLNPDKRVNTILFRIETDGKTIHKVVGSPALYIEKRDEDGEALYESWRARRAKTPKTLEERLAAAQAKLEAAQAEVDRLKAEIEKQEK